jgi:hypothetical protein
MSWTTWRVAKAIVGFQNVGRPIRLAASARSDDVQLIGLTISPTHPALGRELRDIPLLSNLPARARDRAGAALARP